MTDLDGSHDVEERNIWRDEDLILRNGCGIATKSATEAQQYDAAHQKPPDGATRSHSPIRLRLPSLPLPLARPRRA